MDLDISELVLLSNGGVSDGVCLARLVLWFGIEMVGVPSDRRLYSALG